MNTWSRVFGTNDADPEPAVLLELVRCLEPRATGKFSGDAQGWFRAVFTVDPDEPSLILERYLVSEEGIRSQIMTWIAWLETCRDKPNRERLTDLLIATKQLFTLHASGDDEDVDWGEDLCVALCQGLARMTDGVFQIDDRGFHATDGTLLLEETVAD